jgi:hypothetical protein
VVDYDRILAYPRDVPFVRRAHNLQQLLELLRALVPADDRLQLLQTYSEQAGLSEAEKAYCVTVALG